MGIPKRKNNIKVFGVDVDTDGAAVTGRRKELLERITKSDSFLPDSILHDDLDLGMLEYVKENFKVISDGTQIPIIPKILTIQRWSEFTNNWTFSDDDGNIKLPFIAVVRKPDAQPGTNPSIQRTIPDRREFFYASVPTWDGNKMGADVYKIPQPVAIDITFDVTIVCNKFRDVNRFNKIILQKFSSRQSYTTVKGHYIPIVLDRIEDSTPMDTLDGRRFYIQNYTFTLLGFLIDDEEFEVKPAISRILKVAEVDVSTKKKSPIFVENEITIGSVYSGGSIVASYSATTSSPVDRLVEVSFIDQLEKSTGGTVDVPVNIFIEKNNSFGSLTKVISGNYSELNKTNTFSGLTINTSKSSRFEYIPIVTSEFIPELTPTPTPTSVNPDCDITYQLVPSCDVTYEIVPFDVTPTVTPTNTVTPTPTQSLTPTITPTNTVTPTITPTNTVTPTPTQSPLPPQIFFFQDCCTNKIYKIGEIPGTTNITVGTNYYIESTIFTGCTVAVSGVTNDFSGFYGSITQYTSCNDCFVSESYVCPTPTPTQTPTNTVTPTITPTPSITPTITSSITPTMTPTTTTTPTPTKTITPTPTLTVTPTTTTTPTPTPTPIPNQDLIVFGDFTSYNSSTRNRIVKLGIGGTIDNTFSIGSGFNSALYAGVVQSDGKIIIGGSFTSYNGTTRNRIIRLNTNGTIDNTFSIGTGFNSVPFSIQQQSDGKLVVGGSFTSYNNLARRFIVRLNTDGSIDNTFSIGTGFDGGVRGIKIQSDGKILVVGSFDTYNGSSAKRIIRLNTDGSIDNTFITTNNNPDGYGNCVNVLSDGKILFGGEFLNYGGKQSRRIVKLNTDGSVDNSFDVGIGFNAGVYNINIQSDDKIVITGTFTTFKLISASRVIRFNPDMSVDGTFNSGTGFSGSTQDSKVQLNDKTVVVGFFTSYNGTPINRIVRLNVNGSIDENFIVGTGFNGGAYGILTLGLST